MTRTRVRMVGFAVALAALLPLHLQAGVAHGAGRVIKVSPGADLARVMTDLRAGDVLRLRPGTYDTGYLRPRLAPGTAAAPITVTADDLSRPPLLRGGLHLTSAAHWRIDGLRVQATVAGRSALYLDGGGWWSITRSEFFGARSTGSYANVVITSGGGGWPRSFRFAENCVHGGAMTGRGNTDHNIYVSYRGAPGAGGQIVRNVIASHPQGAGIKLGNGGLADAIGPSGVTVAHNTIANGGRQILLHGRVSSNRITGNLLGMSTAPFTRDPRTTAIYVHDVTGTGNSFGNNYVWRSSMTAYDPGRKLASTGDNAVRPDPRMTGPGYCSGWRPTLAGSTAYGRYGNGRW